MSWTFRSCDAERAHNARRQFTKALQRCGLSDGASQDGELIFGELIGNVVQHAPGAIRIHLDWGGEHPVLVVEDEGPGFEYDPSLPALMSESGRGLFIVARLAKEVTVERLSRGSRVRVVLRWRV